MEILKQILQEYKNGYYNEYDLNELTLKDYRELTTWLVENNHINNIRLLELVETDFCVVPMHFEEDTQKA